jgi:outer membrane receptor protein involved in Fe transport
MQKKILALAIATLLADSSIARAEELSLDALKNLSLEQLADVKIVTASRAEESIGDTPSTVIVISKQQIQQRRYTNLIDLMQDLPGVEIQRGTRSSQYNNISFHGHISNSKFLILQDGVRIDSPTGERIPVSDNYPLYHARQVEVVYGPAAALYGADAFAGVINIITENADEVNGAHLYAAAGSDGYTYESLHVGQRLSENLAFTAGGHLHNADTPDLSEAHPDQFKPVDAKNFSGEVIVPAAERENYAAPVYSNSAFAKIEIGKDIVLGANHSYLRHPTSTGDRPDTTLYLPEIEWHTEINTYYGKYQFELSEALSGEVLLDYSTYEVDPKTNYMNVFTNFQPGYHYSSGNKRGAEAQLSYQLNPDHRLIGGASYSSYYSLPVTPDLSHPYNRDLPLYGQEDAFYANTDLPIQFLDLDYSNTAAYLQWQAAWNEQWSSTIGARYDDNSAYGSSLNPRAGIVYKPASGSVAKLLYGEAFRAPSTEEALGVFGTFTGAQNASGEYLGVGFRAPNYDLEPEKSRNLSLNLSQNFTPDLNASVSLYYTEVDNLIVTRDEDVSTQYIPGAVLSRTTIKANAGNESHYGLDLIVNYRYRFGGGVVADAWGSYSFTDGEIQENPANPSLDLPGITPHKLKLGTTLSYGNYFATGKLYLYDRTNTGRADKANPGERLQAPAYSVFDLSLGADTVAVKNLSLGLDIQNVFDRRYAVAHGAGSTTFVTMPQWPRTWMAWMRYSFK